MKHIPGLIDARFLRLYSNHNIDINGNCRKVSAHEKVKNTVLSFLRSRF